MSDKQRESESIDELALSGTQQGEKRAFYRAERFLIYGDHDRVADIDELLFSRLRILSDRHFPFNAQIEGSRETKQRGNRDTQQSREGFCTSLRVIFASAKSQC